MPGITQTNANTSAACMNMDLMQRLRIIMNKLNGKLFMIQKNGIAQLEHIQCHTYLPIQWLHFVRLCWISNWEIKRMMYQNA